MNIEFQLLFASRIFHSNEFTLSPSLEFLKFHRVCYCLQYIKLGFRHAGSMLPQLVRASKSRKPDNFSFCLESKLRFNVEMAKQMSDSGVLVFLQFFTICWLHIHISIRFPFNRTTCLFEIQTRFIPESNVTFKFYSIKTNLVYVEIVRWA